MEYIATDSNMSFATKVQVLFITADEPRMYKQFLKSSHSLLLVAFLFVCAFICSSDAYAVRFLAMERNNHLHGRRLKRNLLMFSKLHRSVWPYDTAEVSPKRFVPMDFDPVFDY
uniref:Transmembrane protein n=1 Tax=Panagrellus redivivus TaxID=6233 RepID=A0A7E4UYT6_PANRE